MKLNLILLFSKIAVIYLSTIQQKLSKSYMDFGSDTNASHPNNFLDYAISLLSEVIHYSHSEQYIKGLDEVSSYANE